MSLSELESNANMLKLIIGICNKYNLDTKIEKNIINIKAFLGPLNASILLRKFKTIDATNDAIIELYGESIKSRRFSIPDANNETRERLLKIISIPGDDAANLSSAYKDTFSNKERMNTSGRAILDMDINDRIDYIKYTNYSSLFRDEYIFIDSRYQNTVNTDASKLVFNLITNSKLRTDNGGIIVGNNIKDIVSIEISPFTIPYKPVFVNFYNKITLTINEWVSNSYEAYEGGQFHFIFDIDRVDNNLIYLTPIDNVYTFSKPMNYIDNFTLSFGAMLPKITFDKDRMYAKSFDYKSKLGIITFGELHNLVTGDLIYISGFTTLEEAQDVETINEINRSAGHIIVKKDNYSILINVDFSKMRRIDSKDGSYPIDSFKQNVLIYFASKRIKIPLRVKYLTNYLA